MFLLKMGLGKFLDYELFLPTLRLCMIFLQVRALEVRVLQVRVLQVHVLQEYAFY